VEPVTRDGVACAKRSELGAGLAGAAGGNIRLLPPTNGVAAATDVFETEAGAGESADLRDTCSVSPFVMPIDPSDASGEDSGSGVGLGNPSLTSSCFAGMDVVLDISASKSEREAVDAILIVETPSEALWPSICLASLRAQAVEITMANLMRRLIIFV